LQNVGTRENSRIARKQKRRDHHMKRILLLPLALFAALVVAASAGADTKTVQITKNGFVPSATT
jgi:hypothetical protein